LDHIPTVIRGKLELAAAVGYGPGGSVVPDRMVKDSVVFSLEVRTACTEFDPTAGAMNPPIVSASGCSSAL
jgi:hypothetical protein